jgi:hypothetical protein
MLLRVMACIGRKHIERNACDLRNSFQQLERGRRPVTQQIANGSLLDSNPLGELCLRQLGRLKVSPKCFHPYLESIGFAYEYAIGRSNRDLEHSIGVMKKAKRSVLDRALEALAERFPRERPTQVRLAALAGVKQPSVAEWRDGVPAMETAIKLSLELGVCVEWLLTERGPKYPPPAQSDSGIWKLWQLLGSEEKDQVVKFADFIKEKK